MKITIFILLFFVMINLSLVAFENKSEELYKKERISYERIISEDQDAQKILNEVDSLLVKGYPKKALKRLFDTMEVIPDDPALQIKTALILVDLKAYIEAFKLLENSTILDEKTERSIYYIHQVTLKTQFYLIGLDLLMRAKDYRDYKDIDKYIDDLRANSGSQRTIYKDEIEEQQKQNN